MAKFIEVTNFSGGNTLLVNADQIVFVRHHVDTGGTPMTLLRMAATSGEKNAQLSIYASESYETIRGLLT
jgi:hypothetical protein